jgi:hypothetical protein
MKLHESIKSQTAFAKKHLDVKLIRRLRIFIIMYLILLGFIVYDIAEHGFNPFLIIAAFLSGIIVGYIAGRMFNIQWHTETSKVVARLDTIGVIVLILYIIFTIAREKILGVWFAGPLLTGVSLTFATGAILGRILMMSKNIAKVLRNQGIQLQDHKEMK